MGYALEFLNQIIFIDNDNVDWKQLFRMDSGLLVGYLESFKNLP